jgi:peptide/nickel transport system permease protein
MSNTAMLALARVALAAPTVIVVSIFVFAVMHAGVVDPAVLLAGDRATETDIAAIRAQLGLGTSLVSQYLRWADLVVSGDFGRSLYTGRPVVGALTAAAEPTALIAVGTTLLSSVAGAGFGVLAAMRRGRLADRMLMSGSVIGFSVPVFVLGYLLMLLFSLKLRWFPVQGYVPLAEDPFEALRSVTLPILALTPVYLSLVARTARASALDVMRADYVRAAAAKGLSPWRVTTAYVLLNSLLPIITAVGGGFALLIGGTVVTEIVFSIPGLGRLLVDAVLRRDYPTIQGVILVLSILSIIVNLGVDLLYLAIDPRLRR